MIKVEFMGNSRTIANPEGKYITNVSHVGDFEIKQNNTDTDFSISDIPENLTNLVVEENILTPQDGRKSWEFEPIE